MLDPKLFAEPPMEYRGAPFWSINDKLDPEEVARQVDRMVDAGFGGAFFHAREGLVTLFLGEEWFEAFRAAVEAAKRLGAYIWMYDELRWPSGFAGGLVPARDPGAAAKALVAVASERAFSGPRVVAAFRVHLDERGVPIRYERAEAGEAGKAPLYLTFVEYVAQPGETWYEGFCYVDLLDRGAVKLFIEEAYEPYLRFREEFGRTIPGVFTDEPNIESSRPHPRVQLPPRGPRFPAVSLPWTGRLPEKFRELNGYDIVGRLPELIFDLGDYLKTRYDFWRTVTLLFVEAFSRQIYEWCEKHGLKFTGHYLAEDSLLSQLKCAGAVMPHYEYQHVPGIDHLGFQIWGSLLTAKQVASVANQLGRERVLCETYGCTGNCPTFADRKWIGDFLYALGVNLLNHHLLPYSLRGRRKRDYGLNFHWAQPWWRYNRLIEDYFARLSYALSRGVRVANVLVVHPIGSAWALYTPLAEKRVAELDESLGKLLRELLALHIDFELGDETIMAKHSSVEGRKLRVGRALYDAVIVPPSVTIASTTLKLLTEFARAGGTLIFTGTPPERVEGVPSSELKDLVSQAKLVPLERSSLEEALKGVPRPVLIEGDPEGSVLYHLRELDDGLLLFLANTDRAASRSLRIGIEGAWKPELWNAFTGEVRDLGARESGARTWVELELPPIGSTLIRFTRGEPLPPEPKLKPVLEVTISESGWELKRLEPNALVLDYCRFSVDGGSWSDVLPVWRAQRLISTKGLGTCFALKFEFECLAEPASTGAKLVLEQPHLYDVKVNGKPVTDWERSWFDPSFGVADASSLLVQGVNTVELSGTVGVEPELEPIYIFGSFGVEPRPRGASRIVEERRIVDASDLCREGLPFYAGSVELRRSFELPSLAKRVALRFSELNAALAEVYVNGGRAGEVFLPPFEVDVTGLVKPGVNDVRVVLVGTLRNLFGPLHYAGGDPAWTGPETFTDEAHWIDEYVLRPFGFKGLRAVLYG
ncbi:MAG: glycosyl hydrolase [Thermofilaceae archaeon]